MLTYQAATIGSGGHTPTRCVFLGALRPVLVVARLLGVHGAYGVAEPPPDRGGPVAKISLPWDQPLVRADVPVFGLACGPDFKRYVLELGQGSNPTEWHPIAVSTHPRRTDAYAAGEVEWNSDSGAQSLIMAARLALCLPASYHVDSRHIALCVVDREAGVANDTPIPRGDGP